MRFVAWVGGDRDGHPRLRVLRVGEGGMHVGDPVMDLLLDDADEADDVLTGHGWTRTGSWWRVPTGARASVTPRTR